MHRWLLLALVACRDEGAPPADAAPTDSGGLPTECTADCAETKLRAEFRLVRTLDRAVFGNNGDGTLHVEAYLGGEGCPSESSPTPDYTLVLGKVAPPNGPAPTIATGNVLDFVGDLLGGELGAQAHTVIVRAVAAKPSELVALDVDLDFVDGNLDGHLFATHCPSLDSP